uniref:Uncharacterized protein n=1 Tax=Vespula pensylvanica TaxID=30213 RepID=A0A834P5Z0_VESPE|nr:hypothetical protein H0235_006018 [Vespula pensylvanica]
MVLAVGQVVMKAKGNELQQHYVNPSISFVPASLKETVPSQCYGVFGFSSMLIRSLKRQGRVTYEQDGKMPVLE